MSEKKKPKAKITKEKCNEYLRVKLTDKQILSAAREASTALLKKARYEDELKGIKDKFKSDIEFENLKMKTNSQLVEDGYEYRTIACVWTKDWEKGTKTLTRLDTNEEVKKDVKIEPSERQTTAF